MQIYMKKNIIVYIKPWVFNSNWYEGTITMWRYVKSKCEKSGMLIWKKKSENVNCEYKSNPECLIQCKLIWKNYYNFKIFIQI